MSTYALYGFLYPKEDKAAALKELLLALVEPTRKEEGIVQYDIYEEDNGTLFMYEVWRSKEDFERHLETPHMKQFMQEFWDKRMDYLTRDIEAHSARPITAL